MRSFIAENLTFAEDPSELDAQLSMLENDIIDSTSILELVMFLEERFAIKVEDAEVVPDNLDSLQAVTRFVESKLAAKPNGLDLEQLKQAS